MNIREEISKLRFPRGEYIVAGSGLLNTLGIRQCNDIDMVVSESLYQTLVMKGWEISIREDGTERIVSGIYDCMTDWHGKDLRLMLHDAIYIDTIPYMSLEKIYDWKKSVKRPKDLEDMELIRKYLTKSIKLQDT